MPKQANRRRDQIDGVLLGTAVGDALGLPYEGLSRRRLTRMLPETQQLTHRMYLGRGLVSDDTEHTFILGRALTHSREDPKTFQRELARGLRRWFLACPPGIGWGTLRACLRLCVGLGPDRSGVASAGNGPAMRAALLGLIVSDQALSAFVSSATRLTHSDPRAYEGALIVARAARLSTPDRPTVDVMAHLVGLCENDELRAYMQTTVRALEENLSPDSFLSRMGLEDGVTGYVNHTVPAAVFAWARAESFADGVNTAIRFGGDTDTVGAITGALCGARFGASQIPTEWIGGIHDHPITTEKLRHLGAALADGTPKVDPVPVLPSVVRNLGFFTPLVFAHLLRRLAPPW